MGLNTSKTKHIQIRKGRLYTHFFMPLALNIGVHTVDQSKAKPMRANVLMYTEPEILYHSPPCVHLLAVIKINVS